MEKPYIAPSIVPLTFGLLIDITNLDANEIPESPGVYAFFDGPKCMYIGHSQNLRGRLRGHERKRQLSYCQILFMTCANHQNVEHDLMHALQPVKNGKSPDQEITDRLRAAKLQVTSDAAAFIERYSSEVKARDETSEHADRSAHQFKCGVD